MNKHVTSITAKRSIILTLTLMKILLCADPVKDTVLNISFLQEKKNDV